MLRLMQRATATELPRKVLAASASCKTFSSAAEAADLPFDYVRHNERPPKPRTRALT